jgi:hypothetical protein
MSIFISINDIILFFRIYEEFNLYGSVIIDAVRLLFT